MVKQEELKISNNNFTKEYKLYTDEKIKTMQKDFLVLIENKLKVIDDFPPLNVFIKQHEFQRVKTVQQNHANEIDRISNVLLDARSTYF